MALATDSRRPLTGAGGVELSSVGGESTVSGVSWGAILAGALAAIAIALLLIALGSGIGLASVSPWSAANPSATTFTVMAAVWLIIVQWVSSAGGGYITGRLRTKWAGLNTDEVFFRDTAHGFLAWAVASVLVAVVASSAVSSGVSAAGQAVSSVASGAASGATQVAGNQASDPSGYFLDTLFRADQPRTDASPAETRAEASRIVARSVSQGSLSPADKTYLAKLISARTGLSQADAEKRIDDTMAQMKAAADKAREAADAARKAASATAFFTFFSMLVGAFIAAVAGAIGGRERDAV